MPLPSTITTAPVNPIGAPWIMPEGYTQPSMDEPVINGEPSTDTIDRVIRLAERSNTPQEPVETAPRILPYQSNLGERMRLRRQEESALSPDERNLRSRQREDKFLSIAVPLIGIAEAIATRKNRYVEPTVAKGMMEQLNERFGKTADYAGQIAKREQERREQEQETAYRQAMTDADFSTPEGRAAAAKTISQYDEPKNVLDYIEALSRMEAGQRDNAWQARANDWAAVLALPPGKEQDAAERAYWMKWAPSIGYQSSSRAIEDARKRAQASAEGSTAGRIGTEAAMAGTEAGTAAQIATAKAGAEYETPGQEFQRANALRDEFNTLSKEFNTITDGVAKVLTASKGNTATDDMSLIYGFMKVQDPSSTVREGEYATAEQARGIPAYIVGLYNKALSGQRLTPEQRRNFANTTYRLYGDAKIGQMNRVKRYSELAKGYGIDPSLVITPPREFDSPLQPKPPVAPGAAPRITNDADYDALPSGAQFYGPDGKLRRKP